MRNVLRKRLVLGKTTIANLDRFAMSSAKGGCTTETIGYTCDEACTTDPNLNDTVEKPSANTCYSDTGVND